MAWTTKLSDLVPEALTRYGAEEIYAAYFVPEHYGGIGPAVALGLPECELIMTIMADGEPLSVVNRPQVNRNIKKWIKAACLTAVGIEPQAVISFNCDTPEQLEYALKLAPRWLLGYERVPLERMEEPEGRTNKGNLS